MRRLAHISDLHFGAHDPGVVEALRLALVAQRPDLVIVSGDVSQRARTVQFLAADAFLSALEEEGLRVLVVPGNHDVPTRRPIARLFRPLHRYRRLVGRARADMVADDAIAVLGLVSAHGLTVKDGRLTGSQIRSIVPRFEATAAGAVRILVTHHPLVALPHAKRDEVEPALAGARRALEAVRRAGVHLVLAGHHHTHGVVLAGPGVTLDPQVMVVQAGTATSWRRRGLSNSFNMIEVSPDRAEITEWTSSGNAFVPEPTTIYRRSADTGWRPAP